MSLILAPRIPARTCSGCERPPRLASTAMLAPAEILTERDPALDAYVARPVAGAAGGVVVFHELFGLTTHVRAVADRLARSGYAAVVPNLHRRTEPALELAHDQAGPPPRLAPPDGPTPPPGLQDAPPPTPPPPR